MKGFTHWVSHNAINTEEAKNEILACWEAAFIIEHSKITEKYRVRVDMIKDFTVIEPVEPSLQSRKSKTTTIGAETISCLIDLNHN